MSLTIENKTPLTVLVRYNSGRTHYLAPRETCEVEHAEIKGKGSDASPYNARITHLIERRVVAVHQPDKKKAPARRRPKKARK